MNNGKNQGLFWMKLKKDFFYDERIEYLMEDYVEGSMIVLIYELLCLETLNTNGYLVSEINGTVRPMDEAEITTAIRFFPEENVRSSLKKLKEVGLISTEEDDWMKMEGRELL